MVITILHLSSNKDLISSNKDLTFYKTVSAIPFKDNKISILGKDITINENQKYYLLNGDCSKVTEDSDTVISYDPADNFKGVIQSMIRPFTLKGIAVDHNSDAEYFEINIITNYEVTGYVNKDYVYNDKSGYDKTSYDQIYYISLMCDKKQG